MNSQIFNQDIEESAKGAALKALGENFGKTFSPELAATWLELLAPYPAAMVSLAVKVVILGYEYKTLPPFAVLKKALDELTGVSEKTLELQAIAEWTMLTEAMPTYGAANKPDLHPTTDFVLRILGGWLNACCHWHPKDMDFKRKDFIRLWVESHGRTDHMRLGAAGVMRALAIGLDRRGGLVSIRPALEAITAGDGQ